MAKILVIDDEALLARSLMVILTKAGHTVVTAENGKLGLEMFDREHPDLVITDIIMPVMEGIEAIQALRTKDPKIPIIAVSGGGRTKNLEFLRIAEKLGANAAIGKPFSKEQLFDAINKCLGGLAS